MERKIGFKEWVRVVFGGIRQLLKSIFSSRNRKVFWRVICAVITVCLVIITGIIIYEVRKEYIRDRLWADCEPISNSMYFCKRDYSTDPGWIAAQTSGEIITKDIDWIKTSSDEDSLAVFASKGKRGFLNRYTGKVVIKPQFDKAWVFSSGVAAVVKGNKLFFIDHDGKPINEKTHAYHPKGTYLYYGDLCAMTDGYGRIGLIDKEGNWKVEPKFEKAVSGPRNYWMMQDDSYPTTQWYAYTDKGEPVNDMGTTEMDIVEDLGVVYTLPNHLKMVVDFDGNRMESFICRDIEPLYYNTGQRDTDNLEIQARCTLYRYRMDDGYEGLCKENGDIVTDPLYWDIRPINKDLYHCLYKDSGVGVIIDSNGKISEGIRRNGYTER